ncbi:hypothetical protein AMTRI_Chr07g76530 [Amborella trichopoda]
MRIWEGDEDYDIWEADDIPTTTPAADDIPTTPAAYEVNSLMRVKKRDEEGYNCIICMSELSVNDDDLREMPCVAISTTKNVDSNGLRKEIHARCTGIDCRRNKLHFRFSPRT